MSLFSLSRGGPAARARQFRPRLESLEDRAVPAFLGPAQYSTGATPWDVQTADVNRDGKLDVVTTGSLAGHASIFLGNGDGTFQQEFNYLAQIGVDGVAAGDFNRDAVTDILWHNETTGETQIWFMDGSQTITGRATVVPADGGSALVGAPFFIVPH